MDDDSLDFVSAFLGGQLFLGVPVHPLDRELSAPQPRPSAWQSVTSRVMAPIGGLEVEGAEVPRQTRFASAWPQPSPTTSGRLSRPTTRSRIWPEDTTQCRDWPAASRSEPPSQDTTKAQTRTTREA